MDLNFEQSTIASVVDSYKTMENLAALDGQTLNYQRAKERLSHLHRLNRNQIDTMLLGRAAFTNQLDEQQKANLVEIYNQRDESNKGRVYSVSYIADKSERLIGKKISRNEVYRVLHEMDNKGYDEVTVNWRPLPVGLKKAESLERAVSSYVSPNTQEAQDSGKYDQGKDGFMEMLHRAGRAAIKYGARAAVYAFAFALPFYLSCDKKADNTSNKQKPEEPVPAVQKGEMLSQNVKLTTDPVSINLGKAAPNYEGDQGKDKKDNKDNQESQLENKIENPQIIVPQAKIIAPNDVNLVQTVEFKVPTRFNEYGEFLGRRGAEQWENKDYLQSAFTGLFSWLNLVGDGAKVIYKPAMGELGGISRSVEHVRLLENGVKTLGGASRTLTSNAYSLLTKLQFAKEDTWKVGARDAEKIFGINITDDPNEKVYEVGREGGKEFAEFVYRNISIGPNANRLHAEFLEWLSLNSIEFDTTMDPYVKEDGLPGYLTTGASDTVLMWWFIKWVEHGGHSHSATSTSGSLGGGGPGAGP